MFRRRTVVLILAVSATFLLPASTRAQEYIAIPLHRAELTSSYVYGADHGRQVGVVEGVPNQSGLVWFGSPDKYTYLPGWPNYMAPYALSGDVVGGQQAGGIAAAWLYYLKEGTLVNLGVPTGFTPGNGYGAVVLAVGDGEQAGYASKLISNQSSAARPSAFLWRGTADSAVNLDPALPQQTQSWAFGVSGGKQIGTIGNDGYKHAVMWSGTAASMMDLHPSNYSSSWGRGIKGNEQVGSASGTDGRDHAMVWHGTAASAVDLHPPGLITSTAAATNGFQQAGYANLTGTATHAYVWSGTAGSAVDLHQFVPTGYDWSQATGIDEYGNIVGNCRVAGGAMQAFLWKPVPSIIPKKGGNTGTVSVRVYIPGLNMVDGTQIRLVAPGQPDIVGQNSMVRGPYYLTSTLDLRGAEPGARDVIVTLPDATVRTLSGAFSIEKGGGPKIWTEVVGRSVIRAGVDQTFTIQYGNTGNTDAVLTTIWISFPKYLAWKLSPDQILDTSGETDAGDTLLSVDIAVIPPGTAGSFPVTLKLPDDPLYAHATFQVRSWSASP